MKHGNTDLHLELMFQSYDLYSDIDSTANAIDRYFIHGEPQTR